MLFKKLTCIFLSLTLLCLVGCGKGNNKNDDNSSGKSEAENVYEMQLLFCANDTLNPYKTISKLNSELSFLLFDPLLTLDNNFEIVYRLASSVKTEGNICTVTLRSAVFSDAATVTSADVIYSYNLAKSSSLYSQLFYEVSSVYAEGDSTVVFNLTRNDPYFAKLLTFPILKEGSDSLKNEDNVEIPPIGCGRFVYDPENTQLIPNKYYYNKSGNVEKIKLTNAPDNESMKHYVEVGATDIYYSDANDGTIIRMSGKKESANLNSLVYIGINHNYTPLRSSQLRYALSTAVDRDDLVKTAFYTNAKPATGFFHPDWSEVSSYQTLNTDANLKISIENLERIGYNNLDKNGYRLNENGNPLTLTLLVNEENPTRITAANMIVDQFKAVGIKLIANPVNSDTYYRALRSGNYQLYLGEVKLLPNMDISSLVIPGGSAAYGITSSALANESASYHDLLSGFYSGENSIVDVAPALLSAMPIIPLLYRSSVIFYSDKIADIGDTSSYDVYLSIGNYKFKK